MVKLDKIFESLLKKEDRVWDAEYAGPRKPKRKLKKRQQTPKKQRKRRSKFIEDMLKGWLKASALFLSI